jgi:hypothetical protein
MTDEEIKRHVAAIIARDVKVPALEAALIRATHEIQACKDALAQCRCGDLPADDRDDRA